MEQTLEQLHKRIMEIEQYLMDKEENKHEVPWFNTDRVNNINDEWKIVK